ncbi:MAG: hypothetical protein N3B16_07590 [Candidatus Aminicenantes bacterium]|nr:hypothetical protein [Candidatus Aminicenantes bacterium]
MKLSVKGALASIMMLLASLSPFLGQQQSRNGTFQVTLYEWYDIYISPSTITFTDVPPEISSSPPKVRIEANENPVSVRAFAIIFPKSNLQLTVTANSDFDATIPASTVSWDASGSGYQAGQLLAGKPVVVGQWTGSTIVHWHEGKLNFYFDRDYVNQVPGTYSITATFTLSKV